MKSKVSTICIRGKVNLNFGSPAVHKALRKAPLAACKIFLCGGFLEGKTLGLFNHELQKQCLKPQNYYMESYSQCCSFRTSLFPCSKVLTHTLVTYTPQPRGWGSGMESRP